MSDDKKLLSENTIRRFMTLANVGALSGAFIQENSAEDEPLEEEAETDEETLEEAEEEMATEEEPEAEEEMATEEEPAELGMEEEPAELGSADISLTEEEAQLLIDLGSRLGAALGDAGEAADDEMAMDDMDDMDDMEDMGGMEEPAPEAEEPAPEEEMMQEQEALVQEVLKRVTKRIISEKLKKNK